MPREVLIIDDAMDEDAVRIASRFNVRILKNPGKGVSAARNFGARSAEGAIILFIDTDVILPPDALERLHKTFKNPDIDGIVGIQTAALRFTDFFSRYKNQWMRFTYRRLKKNIHLFYTSCAAIRKDVFDRTPGFDENYRLPSVEDTAFGAVLGSINARIITDPHLEIEHVKKYTFYSVLITDLKRSSALVRYVLRMRSKGPTGKVRETSVPRQFMFASALMAVNWLSPLLFPVAGSMVLPLFFFLTSIVVALNASWIKHLANEEGSSSALKACFFIPLDVTFVVAGIGLGVSGFLKGAKY